MPTDYLNNLKRLCIAGLKSVGMDHDIFTEEGCLIIRDILADVDKKIIVFKADDPESPIASFPKEAILSAATFICFNIVSSVVARAIEDEEQFQT